MTWWSDFWTWLDESPTRNQLAVALFILAITVLGSFVIKKIRKVTWTKWIPWLWARRPIITTAKRRHEAAEEQDEAIKHSFDAGWNSRNDEVLRERESAREPRWHPSVVDEEWAMMRNSGFKVANVRISAPREDFSFEEDAFWDEFGSDSPGASIGLQFKGRPTATGRREGVTFDVSWQDQHGDHHSDKVELPPRVFSKIKPVWQIARAPGGERGKWVLVNHAEGSIANDVSLSVGSSYFKLLSAVGWESIPGGQVEVFSGMLTSSGAYVGAMFIATWTDDSGEEWTQPVEVEAQSSPF